MPAPGRCAGSSSGTTRESRDRALPLACGLRDARAEQSHPRTRTCRLQTDARQINGTSIALTMRTCLASTFKRAKTETDSSWESPASLRNEIFRTVRTPGTAHSNDGVAGSSTDAVRSVTDGTVCMRVRDRRGTVG